MKNKYLSFACLVLTIFAGGCSVVSEYVYLHPTFVQEHRDVGKGKHIALSIIDERTHKIIGYRNSLIGAGPISFAVDPKESLGQSIRQILEQRGFVIDEGKGLSGPRCQVSIKDVYYSMNPSILDIEIATRVVLEVDVKGADGKAHYYNYYHSENVNRVFIAPPAQDNEGFINVAVSKVLNNIIQDEKIFETLIS